MKSYLNTTSFFTYHMFFHQLKGGMDSNLVYILGDPASGECAVIDTFKDIQTIMSVCCENNLKITKIINTHSHHDHTEGNDALKEATGAEIIAFPQVKEGDTISIGNILVRVFHTPGHIEDAICLLVENKLIVGDTLFVRSAGRTDLPGGDTPTLMASLRRIKAMDDNLTIYPGHDYGGMSAKLGELKKTNQFLRSIE
jgi:hydroxyacylglutathione hydrolase